MLRLVGWLNDIFYGWLVGLLHRQDKMSVNSGSSSASSASSACLLCYCGVPALVRYSWTDTNTARKWYGCENYKVLFEINIVLYFVC
jgi:hypothetical protein